MVAKLARMQVQFTNMVKPHTVWVDCKAVEKGTSGKYALMNRAKGYDEGGQGTHECEGRRREEGRAIYLFAIVTHLTVK